MTISGFLVFKEKIDRIVEALGEPSLQPAVADHAIRCLEVEVRAARGLNSWGDLHWHTWWTTCSTEEFLAGSRRTEATLAFRPNSLTIPPVAEAPWRGTVMRIRGTDLQAERGGYKLRAGWVAEGRLHYDRQLRDYVPQWQVSTDKDFMRCALGNGYGEGKDAVHAKTEAAAIKSLRRIANERLRIKMVDL